MRYFQYTKNYLARSRIAKHEVSAGNFIPYHCHYNDYTLCSRKYNKLTRVIKFGGFSFETADTAELVMLGVGRNLLLKGLVSNDLILNFHIIRKSQKSYHDNYSSIDMPDGFAKYLDIKWFERHKNHKAFSNDLYISITVRCGQGVTDSFDRSNQGLKARVSKAIEKLDEASGRIINSLKDYHPKLLGVRRTKYGSFSEIAEFMSSILNMRTGRKILMTANKIADSIIDSRLYFGRKAIECKGADGISRFAAIASIKEYGPKTWVGMLDEFLHVPFELIISQSFGFESRMKAMGKMQVQQNRMIQSGDKAVSQIYEISEALDSAMSGEIGFGWHNLTVMPIIENFKELDLVMSEILTLISNTGCSGVREWVNMEPCFWGQIPGNDDYIVRKSTINTKNLASFNSLHNYPLGYEDGNHWGEAVTVLDTTSGTPFYFNFHANRRDVGHTMIVGPTGAGKTVMLNFLCAQAQKFKCRLFFFDKDRGAEIFLRALDGVYTNINIGKVCGFNPLQLPDSAENRAFLLEWLRVLLSVNGETITADDVEIINSAISGNYKLDPGDRRLCNIVPFFGLEGPGTLATRLKIWYGKGSHAKVFDNPQDEINFSKSNIFGFEMGDLLRDKYSLGPVLLYIFHRINMSLDGTPCMIVLDEAWALIDNPTFAPKIKDWLKVLRKLNTFVVFATQSVEDASKSQISDTLVQQTATQIFLPNLRATDVYRTVFMLSEREYELIKTTDPGSRLFLIKQGHDAVVATINLSGMDDIISILSGRAETVVILDEVLKEYGQNPKIWIPEFLKRVKQRNA